MLKSAFKICERWLVSPSTSVLLKSKRRNSTFTGLYGNDVTEIEHPVTKHKIYIIGVKFYSEKSAQEVHYV